VNIVMRGTTEKGRLSTANGFRVLIAAYFVVLLVMVAVRFTKCASSLALAQPSRVRVLRARSGAVVPNR
jgi:hypothetical protein